MNKHRDCPYNYLVAQEGLRDHDKYYDAYHELKDAAIALVSRLEFELKLMVV